MGSFLSNVWRRGARYYFRARIPADLIGIIGRTEYCRSLNTACPSEAKHAAVKLGFLFDRQMQKVRVVSKKNKITGADVLNDLSEGYELLGKIKDQNLALTKEWNTTVQNFETSVANIKLNKVTEDATTEINRAKQDAALVKDLALKLLQNQQPQANSEPKSMSPDAQQLIAEPEIVERFLDTKAGNGAKNRSDYSNAISWFAEIAGTKTFCQIEKLDVIQFMDALQKMPSNASKRLKTNSILKAAKLNQIRDPKLSTLSHDTVVKYLTRLHGYFEWATSRLMMNDNPATGVKPPRAKGAKKHVSEYRDPYTLDELRTVFSAPLFMGCQSAGLIHKTGKHSMRDHHYFWVPLIALFTGARLNEIGQMRSDEIIDFHGILHFDITETGNIEDGEEKKLKTENAKRRIPVHNELIKIGFLDYIKAQKNATQLRLFPEWNSGSDGYYSSTFSKFWNGKGRFLDRIGIKRRKLDFHSFRKSFQDAMDASGIPEQTQTKLIGHSSDDVRTRYRTRYLQKEEAEQFLAFKYNDLDLSDLYK
jgi:integrase